MKEFAVQLIKFFNIRNFLIIASILMLSAFLNHGSLGGDEGKIVQISSKLVDSSLSVLNFLLTTKTDAVLQNHLAWVSVTSLIIYILNCFLHFFSFDIPSIVWNWIIAYPPSLSAALSAFIVFKILRFHNNDFKTSTITVLLIYLCTPISSFLTGGWSECYILLLISIRMFIDLNLKSSIGNIFLLAATDALLIFFKAYSIFFIIALFPLILKNQTSINKTIYILTICFILSAILILKLHMPREFDSNNIFGPNFEMPDFYIYIGRLFDAVFSLDFGILTMPPFIILLIFLQKVNRDMSFYLITIAFICTFIFLCLYSFWHGAAGVAGQRYISPFIIFYSPYIALAMRIVINMFPKVILVIFLLIFIYIPTLNYRNTLIDVYAKSDLESMNEIKFSHTYFPTTNPEFHPAIFASTVAIKKIFFDNSQVVISNKNLQSVTIDANNIIPMTGISRILFIQTGSWKPNDKSISLILGIIPISFTFAVLISLCLTPYILLIFSYRKSRNETIQKHNS